MNAAIRAVVKVAASRGVRVMGIEGGFDGLIDGRGRELTRSVEGGLAPLSEVQANGNSGGTFLGSARSERFFSEEWRNAATNQMLELGIGGLVVIGGNGSIAGAHALATENDLPVVAIPASIDNDIGCTNSAIGVDTALNTITEACDRISDTAQALKRAFIVEVMGRRSGYLAMAAAVASAADAVLLPEQQRTEPELIDAIEKVIRGSFATDRNKQQVLIIKAEGVEVPTDHLVRAVDERLGDLRIDVRATVLGHVVRGGNPSFHDRMLAGRFGLVAVDALLQGVTDVMTAWRSTVPGGAPTDDPTVSLFRIKKVLEETERLRDGTSDVTRRRLRRMEEIQGVLAL